MKQMALRLGLILGAVWLVGGLIAAMSVSEWTTWLGIGVPAVLTVVVVGVVIWALRRAKNAQGVAGILAGVRTDEDRKRALDRLDEDFKSNDPAAIFAKAQLQMQDDPKQALRTLEQVNLSKVMAAVADEARAQRGMIHLMLGEVTQARDLADGIDLSRHQDDRTKAMMSAVIAEAWARTGQAAKAVNTIELFNPEEASLEQLRPQIYRAQAFVYAYANKPKAMRRALKKLVQMDARILGGFMVKKTHPLLQKEAKLMLEQSGQLPRKMQFQRS
ncbi:MAG: hypothetical protein RJA70_4610 [Pseudomonadota bacterium]|jgi:hypothetical protein